MTVFIKASLKTIIEKRNVEHALERFYFYVTGCMKYKNFFVGLEEEEEEKTDE